MRVFQPYKTFSSLLKPPILDLKVFQNSSLENRKRIAEGLFESSANHGFFLVKPVNFPFEDFFKAAGSFFNQDMIKKLEVKNKSKGLARGYIGMGEESGSEQFEVKEAFSYGFDWPLNKPPSNELQGPNLFPAESQFKGVMTKTYEAMSSTAFMLTEILSLSLLYSADYLQGFCKEGHTISLMRIFHYFPYDRAPVETKNLKKIGSSEHTDWGFLTLIAEEPGKRGLQAFCQGEWRDLDVQNGCLVVNCGDYLSLISGGKFKSPLHRVVSQGKERISGVFFYYPDYEARIPMMENQKEYSLFKEQKQGRSMEAEELKGKSFGEYIGEKWKQVTRDGKMY